MKTIKVNVYRFNELCKQSQLRAIEDYRNDVDWAIAEDKVVDYVSKVLKSLGIITDFTSDFFANSDGTYHVFIKFAALKGMSAKKYAKIVDTLNIESAKILTNFYTDETISKTLDVDDVWFYEDGSVHTYMSVDEDTNQYILVGKEAVNNYYNDGIEAIHNANGIVVDDGAIIVHSEEQTLEGLIAALNGWFDSALLTKEDVNYLKNQKIIKC